MNVCVCLCVWEGREREKHTDTSGILTGLLWFPARPALIQTRYHWQHTTDTLQLSCTHDLLAYFLCYYIYIRDKKKYLLIYSPSRLNIHKRTKHDRAMIKGGVWGRWRSQLEGCGLSTKETVQSVQYICGLCHVFGCFDFVVLNTGCEMKWWLWGSVPKPLITINL